MKKVIVNSIKHAISKAGFEVRRIRNGNRSAYSNLNEDVIIAEYLSMIPHNNQYCVDVAAGDGILMSNTFRLFERGWDGLAVEYDKEKFAKLAYAYRLFDKVQLSKCKVTPENVAELLRSHDAPKDFTLLSLDIDGYDYYVLEKILSSFRPRLLCVEVNEKIPPPLKFTVRWDPSYEWAGGHFFGQSLSQLCVLASTHKYSLLKMHYNNAFLAPEEISPVSSLDPEEAYAQGYKNKEDRKEKFPWNDDMEPLLTLPPYEGERFLKQVFSKYEGKFLLSVD